MTFPFRGDLFAVAVAVVVATLLGFLIGDLPLAAYAMLSTAMLGGMYVLWSRTMRSQRHAAASVDKRFKGIEKRISAMQAEQAKGFAALPGQLDALGPRLDAIAAAVEDLREPGGDIARLHQRLESIGETVERIPNQTKKAVRTWTRTVYAELEDLEALYRDINPDRALPPMRGWAAGADLSRFLYSEVTANGRRNIVECGSGSTTVILAYALRANGSGIVTALEHQEEFAEATRRLLAERGLSDWARVVHAPLTDVKIGAEEFTWYEPGRIPDGPIDLCFVDGPPQTVGDAARYPAVPLMRDRLAADAAIVLDDAHRSDERAVGERWQAELPDFTAQRLFHDYGTLVLRRGA